MLSDVDVMCITETHMHSEKLEQLNIVGFQLLGYRNCKKNLKSNTAPGGIAIFVKENIFKLFTIKKTDNENVIWTKLKKELQKREIESRESIEAISKYHQVEVI